MSAIIYLVTVGRYSSYQILAAFTSREQAELLVARFPCGSRDRDKKPGIEEFPLDPDLSGLQPGYRLWYVQMDAEGNLEQAHSSVSVRELDEAFTAEDSWSWLETAELGNATVYARDLDQAVKIVNEQRSRWKAERGAP